MKSLGAHLGCQLWNEQFRIWLLVTGGKGSLRGVSLGASMVVVLVAGWALMVGVVGAVVCHRCAGIYVEGATPFCKVKEKSQRFDESIGTNFAGQTLGPTSIFTFTSDSSAHVQLQSSASSRAIPSLLLCN
jgi:hypothetical protein